MPRRVATLILSVSLALAAAAPAEAEAYKSQDACGTSSVVHSTTRMTPFFGHHIDVSERMCTNGTFIKWATQPKISFPSNGNIVASPIESVAVSQTPFIYSTKICLGRPCRITWRFTVKQGIKGVEVNEFVFYYRVYPAHAELCFGKACVQKKWTGG